MRVPWQPRPLVSSYNPINSVQTCINHTDMCYSVLSVTSNNEPTGCLPPESTMQRRLRELRTPFLSGSPPLTECKGDL